MVRRWAVVGLPITMAHGLSAPLHGPGATMNAPGHGGVAPAHDNGRGLARPSPDEAAINDALGQEASARIVSDVLAIAQGVAGTQADIEILRNGF